MVFGAGRLGRVLDDGDPALGRCLQNRIHLRGLAVQMDRDDRGGLPGHRSDDFRGVHVVRRAVDVDEYGFRATEQDGRRGREEREGRDEDFLALRNAVGEQGDVKGRRTVCHRNPVLPSEVRRERILERLDFRTLGEHARGEDLFDRCELVLAEDRAGDRDHPRRGTDAGL